MKRLLTTLILAALLGFAVFKAGVWWLADQRMAEARQAFSEIGVLDRGKIGSGVEGRLVLSKSSWQDFELTQPLAVERMEFEAGSPAALIMALMDPENLPASWTFQAEGLALLLEPTMFRNWVTADGVGESEQAALFALSCAPDPRQQLGSGDLLRMGVTRFAGELVVKQTPERVHLELNSEKTGSLELNWPGARINVLTPEATLQSSDQPIKITLRDGGLMRRIAAYCAREAGVETDQWARSVLKTFDAGLKARGWRASDQLLALYRQWLLEGGQISVSVQPGSEAFGIPVRADGERASGSMDWAPEYNGSMVPDVFLRKAEPVALKPPKQSLEPAAPQENPAVTRWHTANISQASNWAGHKIRITLSSGNVIEGRLERMTSRELDVSREVAGGTMSYPIALRSITMLEVWRRGRAQ